MDRSTQSSPARWRPARADLIVAGLLVLSLGIKLWFATHVDRLPPRNDERAYVEIAQSLLRGDGYPSLFRPPGYPTFIAAIARLGGDVEEIRVAQAWMSTLTVLLLWAIGRRWLGARAGRVTALLVAFDPVLIGFSHLLWTETLFLFLLAAFLALLAWRFDPSRWIDWPLAGLLLGLCGLVRPVVLTAAPWIVLWMFARAWRATPRELMPTLRASVLLAVGACVVVLPWSFRNQSETGRFVIVDTNGAFNFLLGTEPDAMFLDKDDTWSPNWAHIGSEPYGTVAARDPGYAQRQALRIGIRSVLENPARFLAAAGFEGTHLWTLDSFPLRHLRNGWYGPDAKPWMLPVLTAISIPFGVFLLGLGFVGLVTLPPNPLRGSIAILIAHSAILHALLFSLSRFQVPLRALLALAAGYAFVERRRIAAMLWREGRPTRRGWVAAALLCVLSIAWIRDWPLLWDMLVNGGEAHRFVRRTE